MEKRSKDIEKFEEAAAQQTQGTVDNAETPIIDEKESKHRKNRVLIYLTALFAAAFMLLLLSYLINQRDNRAALNDLSETHKAVTESAFQNIEQLQSDNKALTDELALSKAAVGDLEDALESAEKRTGELEDEVSELKADTLGRESRLAAVEALGAMSRAALNGQWELAAELDTSFKANSYAQYLKEPYGSDLTADYEAVAAIIDENN